MALSEVIRDGLAADGTLTGLLTGGIYSFEQTGRNGISRVTTPDAYDGYLLPCAVVRAGEAKAAAAIRDGQGGLAQTVQVYLYDDGESDFSTITSARDQVIELLDRQWISGAGYARRIGGADDLRDPKLNNASLIRVDFEVES